jgi:hypothetical protein
MNDHQHCISCFLPSKCNLKNKQLCEIIKCTNIQCELKFHKCKLDEHLNETCKYSFINCLNNTYGCKIQILRKKLVKHLENCPANIVECKQFRQRTVFNKEKINECSYFIWPDPIDIEKKTK